MQIVWLWPNIDAGTDQISKVLRDPETAAKNISQFFIFTRI